MKLRLVDNWRQMWWRRFSTYLAALNGFFVAYVFSQPILVIGLVGFVPFGVLQVVLAAALGFFAFVLPVLVAHTDQPKMREKIQQGEIHEQAGKSEGG